VELLLAADMKSSPDHRLSDAAMDATVATLRRLQGVATEHQAAQLTGVATAVFRLAVNAHELLERIEDELGLRLRVLSQVSCLTVPTVCRAVDGHRRREHAHAGLEPEISMGGFEAAARIHSDGGVGVRVWCSVTPSHPETQLRWRSNLNESDRLTAQWTRARPLQDEEGQLGYLTAASGLGASSPASSVVAWDSGGASFQLTIHGDDGYQVYQGPLGASLVTAMLVKEVRMPARYFPFSVWDCLPTFPRAGSPTTSV
jgi:hypothetical protein